MRNRTGYVYFRGVFAGTIRETDEGFEFVYDDGYLLRKDALPVSLTLPLNSKVHTSKTMIPYFDGLIPEGWLLAIAIESYGLKENDRMGLLLSCCEDCIGATSIYRERQA